MRLTLLMLNLSLIGLAVSSSIVNRNLNELTRKSLEVAESRPYGHSLEDEEIYKPASPYLFTYDIADNDNNKQFRKESSDGNSIRGSYGYTDANGLYRVVEYIADAKNGFRAKVKSNEPGMDNVEFGESAPNHRRHSNNFKFESLDLDNANPADHSSMSSSPSGAIWPANVYMEVAQPPVQIWQHNPRRYVHSESDHYAANSDRQPTTHFSRRTLVASDVATNSQANNQEFQDQPHVYEESASSLIARNAKQPADATHSPDTIVFAGDQLAKQPAKQLIKSIRRQPLPSLPVPKPLEIPSVHKPQVQITSNRVLPKGEWTFGSKIQHSLNNSSSSSSSLSAQPKAVVFDEIKRNQN